MKTGKEPCYEQQARVAEKRRFFFERSATDTGASSCCDYLLVIHRQGRYANIARPHRIAALRLNADLLLPLCLISIPDASGLPLDKNTFHASIWAS